MWHGKWRRTDRQTKNRQTDRQDIHTKKQTDAIRQTDKGRQTDGLTDWKTDG